jgi:transposase-like protein
MSQHFLLSPAAKTLSLAQVFRMSVEQAEAMLCKDAYDARRPNGSPRFRCKACKADFTITSGTLFDSHKLPLRAYLAAIAVFCNEVKGKSMLALSRDLSVSYKCAFVLAHKLREAMAVELKGRIIGGPGKEAEIDGGYFGGYVKPANMKADRLDRRFGDNQSGKRKAVVVIRERNGNSLPAVFRSEGQALSFIKARSCAIIPDQRGIMAQLRDLLHNTGPTDTPLADHVRTRGKETPERRKGWRVL